MLQVDPPGLGDHHVSAAEGVGHREGHAEDGVVAQEAEELDPDESGRDGGSRPPGEAVRLRAGTAVAPGNEEDGQVVQHGGHEDHVADQVAQEEEADVGKVSGRRAQDQSEEELVTAVALARQNVTHDEEQGEGDREGMGGVAFKI